ncbi:hypothetical protein SDC9_91925 [bioreactor metagenome]|uniref:CBS domain-containing protein n=1 Tax=bioreactor metagenome TaxID=1076179 RepID=A0A644ZW82_9ZZZZ
MKTAVKDTDENDTTWDKNCEPVNRRESKTIASLLTPKVMLAFLEDYHTLRQGLEKMRNHGYTAMPIVAKDGTYIGTISEGDFLWYMLDSHICATKDQEDFMVLDILRKGWNPPVRINATMDELLLRVMDQNFVPVIDDRGKFIGIVTRKSVIKYYYGLLESGKP